MAAAPEMSIQRWHNAPAELVALPQWVVWRHVERDGRATKLPFQAAAPSRHARTDDPATWSDFAAAVAAAGDPANNLDGIGFVFAEGDPYCGIDFDHCLGPGRVEPFADGYLRSLGGYQEISPSGSGIKVIVRADLHAALVDDGYIDPDRSGRRIGGKGPHRKGAVEVYDRVRFFTITGNTDDNPAAPIPSRQEEVEALVRDLFPKLGKNRHDPADRPPVVTLLPDDEALLAKARSAANGDRFAALFDRGDHGGRTSGSEADLALCNMLAFWCGDDPDRIDRLFRRSALARPKWIDRADYREWTIAKAVEGRTEFYKQGSAHNAHRTHKNTRPTTGQPEGEPISVGSAVNVGGFLFHEDEWQEPRLGGPDPADPFPLEVLPDTLQRFCEEAAASIQCPIDFLAAQMVVLSGAAIGMSVNLEVKRHYYEATNLYLALVGAPGEKKSPPIKIMSRALWSIDADLRREYDDEFRVYQERLQEWEADKRNPDRGLAPEPPVQRQLTLDDATREAVVQIHSQNLRGLCLIKPELLGWVKALNAFKQKGDDRQFWLSVNSNETVKVSRKGSSSSIIVPQPCVAIVGGLQPDILPEFRESKADDGWLDRILFCYPDAVDADEWTDDAISDGALEDWEATVRRLYRREMVIDIEARRVRPYYVHMTERAAEHWKARVKLHRAEKKDPEFSPSLRGPWAKYEGYAARLALILAQLHQAADSADNGPPRDVDTLDVWGAWKLIDYFKAHFRRARSLLVRKPNLGREEGEAILRWVGRSLRDDSTAFGKKLAEQGGRKFFSRRDVDVQFNWWDDEEHAAGLAWLVRRRVIRPGVRDESSPPTRGRPHSQVYELNPNWIRPTITAEPTEIGNGDGSPSGSASSPAIQFLRSYLHVNPMRASDIRRDAASDGIDDEQLRRASVVLGVRIFAKDGEEYWGLGD